ncbi:hypothetical protein [Facilibium subflavum]|uniref:hypothetical protein n=1 Tax=Facilibium subflavum TaxID=2219058 RepID=UPI000E6569CE|nr:hypothetical protein [Facilibium subflavum]
MAEQDNPKTSASISTIICFLIGILLIVASIILIISAFAWSDSQMNLYRLDRSLITGMIGSASLLVGCIFILVGFTLYRIDHNKKT